MHIRLAILIVSSSALAYEILLMRLFSITQWHQFAYMIISLALLGFGASGSFVAIAQRFLAPRLPVVFALSSVLFSLTATSGFALAQLIPLNPLEILWDRMQWAYLFLSYLVLMAPFFFAATCISVSFTVLKEEIHRLYLFDLLGAGAGALWIILLLYVLPAESCLKVISALGFVAAALASMGTRSAISRSAGALLLICGGLQFLVWPDPWLVPRISEYKGLSMALQVPGSRVLSERHSPLGSLAVVESPAVPFRHAPGMSLNCTTEPPPQLAVFNDGDSLSPITRYSGRDEDLSFLDCLSSSLAYHLLRNPEVLVLGAGGGMDVLMALHYKANRIDAVELDPNMVRLVKEDYSEYAGNIYGHGGVLVDVAEARGFAARSTRLYDLIQISLMDSLAASAAGSHALGETYLYTVEALEEYLRHLGPEGILSVTRWLRVPPRDVLKLFATAVQALRDSGTVDPGSHLAVIRNWNTSTLLVKRSPFTTEEVSIIRSFCMDRSFDADYYPGVDPGEVNRFNVLDKPYIYEGATALLSREDADFMKRYKFFIAPSTDDRPYFFHFFKWRTLPEIVSKRGRGGLPLIEWTYPVLVLTLLQALLASVLLILLPLRFLKTTQTSEYGRARVAFYFGSLGFAFLFIEMAFLQKFTLFLAHPLYAVSVVLAGFLIFAGLGSSFSHKWKRSIIPGAFSNKLAPIGAAILGIAVFSLLHLWLLPHIFGHFITVSNVSKVLISLALIAPLAFFMGMPFPLGLSILAEESPLLIPWAWGINGCASVMSAVLGTLLAIHFGFIAVIGMALALYVLAAFTFRGR